MNEVWKFVGTENEDYSVSNLGRIRSNHRVVMRKNGVPNTVRERILKPNLRRDGYYVFGVGGTRPQKSFTVHSAVIAAFVGPRPEGLEINHIDGDKTNNRLDNLEYCTRAENIQHAFATGLIKPVGLSGEDNNQARLTELQVRDIWESTKSQRKTAAVFGVSKSTVARIKNRQTWKHLDLV
jgi:hypothetical protein